MVVLVLPGAGSAEERMERQASSSGRLDMRNLGMHKMPGWARFYHLRIAVDHHRNPPLQAQSVTVRSGSSQPRIDLMQRVVGLKGPLVTMKCDTDLVSGRSALKVIV
jgi:hypothetical protein